MNRFDHWLFDVDDTLYDKSHNLFVDVYERIHQFLAVNLEIDIDKARALQVRLSQKYGSVLQGLTIEFAMLPHDYLNYLHSVNVSRIPSNLDFRASLEQLGGKKICFTNSTRDHTERILKQLDISGLIDEIFDIYCSDFSYKPHLKVYESLISAHSINPTRAIYFDDKPENLFPAKKLGMQTVLISGKSASLEDISIKQDTHIDYIFTDINQAVKTFL